MVIAAHYPRQVKTSEQQNRRSLLRILVAERLAVLVVGEELAVTTQIDDRPQRPLRIVLGHVVLKLLTEAGCGRAMGRALVENALNMGGEGNVRQRLVTKHFLALIDVHIDEALTERRQLDIGILEFRQA